MQRSWRNSTRLGGPARAKLWMLRILFAVIAAIISVVVLSTFLVWQRRPPWWVGDALPSDPGTFVRKLPLNYTVCAPWAQKTIDQVRSDLRQTELFTAAPLSGGKDINLGLVLPRRARVFKIYCAIGIPAPPQECSTQRCTPPMTFLVMDSLYTRGHVLVFNLRNKAPAGTRPTRLSLNVLWQ